MKNLPEILKIINFELQLCTLHFKLLTKKDFQRGAIKLGKQALISYLITSILIVSTGLIYLFNPFTTRTTEAAWFNDNWGYRKAITLTITSSASDITNLQTLLTVDTTGITANLQTNCEDLRFTSQTSGNILPYYIDSCNDNAAANKIWIMADLVPKNTTTYTMYMYYGNPTAAASTNSTLFDNVVNLKGYWTFNEGSGNTVYDSSIGGNNLTWTGSGTRYASGQYDDAGNFVSATPIFANASAKVSTSGAKTYGAWFKTTATTQQVIFDNNGINSANKGIYMTVNSTANKVTFSSRQGTGGSSNFIITSTTSINDGAWHHAVVTWDGTTGTNGVNLYLDGALHVQATASNAADDTPTNNLYVGIASDGSSIPLDGNIDEIKIYTGVRTAAQISNDYNNKLANGQTLKIATTDPNTIIPSTQSFATEEKAPSPALYLKFDEGTGATAKDASSNALNGTLTNMNFSATGGTTSTSGNYTIHTFTSSGTFTPTGAGHVEYLVVAGGGGGGGSPSGGGGGAGGMLTSSSYMVTSQAYTVTVGAGGAGGAAQVTGTNGSNSVFGSITATGGGGGAGANTPNGNTGGSGGGGAGEVAGSAGSGTAGQGSAGGAGAASPRRGGGGGGAGAAGASGSASGNGGAGTASSISGASVTYAGGGGAGAESSTGGSGGAGGGGSTGGTTAGNGGDGTANTGGGGAAGNRGSGSSGSYSGGAGGSGIVIVRYLTAITTANGWKGEDQCISGKCLYFDGTTNQSVQKSDSALIDFAAADNFTVSAWVKRNGASSAINYILTKADATNGGYKLWMDDSGDLCFGIDDDSSWTPDDSACTSGVDFDDDKWHFVSGVKNGTTSITLYVDGVSRASDSSIAATGTLANTNELFVGVDRDGTSNEWLGFIDEVRVSRDQTARTAAQVAADYNARSNPEGVASVLGISQDNNPGSLSNGLVGYWKTDEASGNLTDSSGNSNTGTATGTTVVAGKFGNGRSFNGSSDVITVTDNSILKPTSQMTVGMWCNVITLSQINCAATKHSTTTNNGYAMFFNSDNKFYFQLGDGVTWATYEASSATISSTGWYHVVGTHDATSTKIYVNGAASGTTGTGGTISQNTNNLLFGKNVVSSAFYIGTMDELRIYNRTLSPAEVTQLYNFAPGPTVYYNMEEVSGNRSDTSGNAITLTDNNTVTSNPGKYGRAGQFTSANSEYLSSTSNATLQTGKDFTWSAWVNMDTKSARMFALGKWSSAGSNATLEYGLEYLDTNDRFSFIVGDGSASVGRVDADNLGSPSVKTWYFVNAYFDDTANTIGISVNGGPFTTAAWSTSQTSTNDFAIGRPGAYDGLYWNGKIDEVKLYKYVRSQSQIVSDMNAGHPNVGSPVASALGHWKFDEGYGTTANNSGSQGSTINGTITSGTWSNSGKFGKAVTYNGTTSVTTVSDNAAIKFGTGSFTISTWAKSTQAGQEDAIIAKDNVGVSNVYYKIYKEANDTVTCAIWDGTTAKGSTSTTTMSTGTWYHLTCMKDGDNMRIFVNGIQEDSDSGASSINTDSTAALKIGAQRPTSVNFFTGDIDEAKIYNYALTADQVKLDMNKASAQVLGAISDTNSLNTSQPQAAASEYCIPGDTSSTSCATPVLRYDFEEGSGSSAQDTTGLGHTGTITSGTYISGKIGKGLDFDGTNTKVVAADASDLEGINNATLSGWIYWDGGVSGGSCNGGACDFIYFDYDYAYYLSLLSDGKMETSWGNGTNSWGATTHTQSTGTISTGVWTHIAVTKSTTTVKYYINGKLDSTTTEDATAVGSNNGGLYIGRHGIDDGRGSFDGKMDNLRIFNYARSAAQIAWDYNKGAPVGHWKLDDCQGSVANDSSGNSNPGTITIGASGTQTAVGTCTGSANTAWKDGVTGKVNYSLDLDGTDDYINVANSSILDVTSGYTLAAWIYPTVIDSYNPVFVRGSGNIDDIEVYLSGSSQGFTLVHNRGNGGTFEFAGHDNSSNVSGNGGWGEPSANTWTHVVVTYDGSAWKVYYNGQQRGNTVTSVNDPTDGNKPWRFGYLEHSAFDGQTDKVFDGQMDDIRIYNYALTATQVKGLYTGGAQRYGPVTGAP